MKEKIIPVNVDKRNAEKNIKELDKSIKETGKSAKSTSENIDKLGTGTENAGKKASGGLQKITTGFNAMGLAIKAAGIGLLISLFNFLRSSISQNEQAMDAINKILKTLSSLMVQFLDVVFNTYNRVKELTNGFESTKAIILDLLKLAITPLKMNFYLLSLGLKDLQLSWEKSFLGKKDPEKIEELTADIEELRIKIKETANEALVAAIDIGNNFKGAIDEFKQVGKVFTEELGDVSVKATNDLANQLEGMRGPAALAIAQAERMIQLYKEQIAQQEILSKDITLSIDERLKASNEALALIEKEKEQIRLKHAQTIKIAELELALNKNNNDAKAALEQAKAAATSAQVAVATKEKTLLLDQNNIVKAGLALAQKEIDGIIDRNKAWSEYSNTRIKDTLERLEAEKELLDESEKIEIEALETKKEQYKEGTTAYVDAQQEILNKQQEYNIKRQENADETEKVIYENRKAYAEAELEYSRNILNNKIDAEIEYLETILELDRQKLENFIGSEEERLELEREIVDREIELDNYKKDKKLQNIEDIKNASIEALNVVQDISDTFTNISLNRAKRELDEKKISEEEYSKKVAEIKLKAAKRDKALALSNAIINTAGAVLKALVDPGGIPGIILSVAAGITGAAQIAKIASTPVESTGGGGGGTSSPSTASVAPTTSFNFSPTTQATNIEPVKSYVISKDVNSQQQLDRQVIANGTI